MNNLWNTSISGDNDDSVHLFNTPVLLLEVAGVGSEEVDWTAAVTNSKAAGEILKNNTIYWAEHTTCQSHLIKFNKQFSCTH